jgi:hypothetical protein
MSDDDRLEEAFRVSLRERAGDVTADGDIAQVVRWGARRRQRIKVAVAGAAAVAVIAPVGILAALNRDGESSVNVADPAPTSGATTRPGTTDPTGSSGGVPANWRVESYDGVQLRVPPDWGWGGVPFTIGGDDEFLTCGHGAFAQAGPDGETVLEVSVDKPYVGRANYGMTDLCMTGLPTPRQPYVWLGSPLEVGSEELENGFTQQTVEVGGLRVTVASDDADELAAILSTVEAIQVDANGCAAVSAPVESGDPVADVEAVDSVSVCVYRHEERGEDVFLGYSTSIEGAPAQHLLEAIKAQPAVDLDCDPDPRLRVDDVVLRFHGANAEADVLVRLDGCSGYYTGEGVRPFFTRANVELWVVDGVGLYVSGFNLGAALSDLFHSPMG